ncbi:single-stranded DNA-binding protein [Caulobacter sp. FWC26]|uniref:single-stranded DNA-binding protein n=1 Tax=Caulobacter sp. FWC26 TaxID=69665 RepID=UPI000C15423E|nr:single-stranded DNA-binding protein [Caulobacter sp. FWC26]AZS19201.1 single-stranded DNA-binding protein [Caulobacter sp. FWC26]
MLNKAQLIGFTGADSEIRTTLKGKKYAVLRVATSRYTKKDNERQDFTTWHQVEIWSPGTVKWLEGRVLAKGSKVYVEGEIRNERYTDKDGKEHYFTKIVVAGPGHELKSLDRPETNPEAEPEPGEEG